MFGRDGSKFVEEKSPSRSKKKKLGWGPEPPFGPNWVIVGPAAPPVPPPAVGGILVGKGCWIMAPIKVS